MAHGVVKSDYENKRDSLINKMNYYFYTPQQKVYDTWSESELRNWLINHDIVKSSAQIDKRKLQKLVAYVSIIFQTLHTEVYPGTTMLPPQIQFGQAGKIVTLNPGLLLMDIFRAMRKQNVTKW